MWKTFTAFLTGKTSENALAIIKVVAKSLSAVHRAEALMVLAEIHEAAELTEKASEAGEQVLS